MLAVRKSRRLLRLKQVYGPRGRIPVGRSMFYDKFVNTGRLRLVPLGERAKAAVEDEVDAIVNEIIAERDA